VSSVSCPACDQVHGGKGRAGYLHDSRGYPGLLCCNWCGRYYVHEAGELRRISSLELPTEATEDGACSG